MQHGVRGDGPRGGLGAPYGAGAEDGRSWPPVPRLWPGETVVVAASGPSLAASDLDYVRRRARLVVVNTTFRTAPWADLLYACDPKWWDLYEDARTFAGLKVTQDAGAAERHGLKRVPGEHGPGLSLDPLRIRYGLPGGGNSGHQALNLAVLLGAGRVVLTGYDMQPGPNGESHHHGDHPRGLNTPDETQMAKWREGLATTAGDLARAGVEVVNASRGTALDCFPRMPIEEAI